MKHYNLSAFFVVRRQCGVEMKKFLFCASACCAAIALVLSIKRYFGGRKCKCTARLNGKTVVITGATSGIGKALAFEVASRGATVFMACRNVKEVQKVAVNIRNKTGNKEVFPLLLDLTDFESIWECCRLLVLMNAKLYAVVNNAAVFYHPKELTADHFDVTFQTNYLGPFYMVQLLLPLMEKYGRIINVSSEAHRLCENLDLPDREADLFYVYGHSKACLNLFTLDLAVTKNHLVAVSVNPGNVETNIFRNFPLVSNPILKMLWWPIRFITVKNPTQGAQSVLHSIICPEIKSGAYISECHEGVPSEFCQSVDNAERLRFLSLGWTRPLKNELVFYFKW